MALAYRHSATSVARHVLTLTLDRYRLPACWIHTEGNAREVDGGNHDRPLVQVDLEDSVISRPNTISSLTQTEGGSDSGNQGVLAAAMGPSAWSPTGIPRIPTAITPELSSSTVRFQQQRPHCTNTDSLGRSSSSSCNNTANEKETSS